MLFLFPVFLSVEHEPEAEIRDNTNNEQCPSTEEQGKRSPIISDPMFAKYFILAIYAFDSNVFW
jgi:hypothetical protein